VIFRDFPRANPKPAAGNTAPPPGASRKLLPVLFTVRSVSLSLPGPLVRSGRQRDLELQVGAWSGLYKTRNLLVQIGSLSLDFGVVISR
jgi:hypothetical protein